MNILKEILSIKTSLTFSALLLNIYLYSEVPAFDSDKPTVTFSASYTQTFNNTWNGTTFYGQWDAMRPDFFNQADISSGYLQFVWPDKRIIYSKLNYVTPYTLTADMDYSAGSSRAGIVIRAFATDVVNSEFLQNPIADPGFNREGIAFYPTDDGLAMNVQFSGVENGALTKITRVQVPKPVEVTSLRNRGILTIEDFGNSIYVYYNGTRYIRIDLGGKTGNAYTFGTVYDANMVSIGTFTGMEVLAAGKVAIAQRDAALRVYAATIKTVISENAVWDNRPSTNFAAQYSQEFTTSWDNDRFYNQWDAKEPNVFGASDITSGYLKFVFPAKRIIYSKTAYATPYSIIADIDYSGGSSRAGLVLRAIANNTAEADYIQEPPTDPGFNREGIAFYPTDDGLAMNVQFSGVESGRTTTTITKITVPKPATVANLRTRGSIKIEDFGASIYVFYNNNPYIRIDLSDKTGSIYTSGTVYNSSMQVVGTFSGMEVEAVGKVAIAQRDAALRLYSADIQLPQAPKTSFDDDKPVVNYTSEYSQAFNTTTGWDNTKFYSQWNAQEPGIFSEEDIASDYLQFVWLKKRIICSKSLYVSPYVLQAEMDYTGGSSRAGVVIRANVTNITDIEYLQEPPFDPGFNREGIAIYPSDDGLAMNVQFSGIEKGRTTTTVTKISLPKPEQVASLRDKGIIRVEDFGTSIYVYYNNSPFFRIDLQAKTGTVFTAGTVYNAKMDVVGTFSGVEVESIGKVAIAQRDAALKLFNVSLKYSELLQQTIQFIPIGKKTTADVPFTLSATASSGLPVVYKLVSGPATLVDNQVSLTGETGIVTISANQKGNTTYYPAPEVLRSFYVSNPLAANVSSDSQDYIDNWVATDALGRTLPTFDEVGSKRQNKKIGVFYYVWNGFHGDKVYDITKILKNHPTDPLSASNTAWGGESVFHFWGESENGYYRSEDPWVIRRDLQMLSNAHVDFIYIDATNAITYLETVKTLCEISMQMRVEGIHTPQIIFTTASKSGQTMNSLYDEFYLNSLFEDLWFKWDGKPLILGDFNDKTLRQDVKDFFTIKYSWAWTNASTEPNHWQWVDTYPQDYGWSTDPAIPEQIVVSVAQHPDSDTGSSYQNGSLPAVNQYFLTDNTGQGLHFAEQWKRALQVNPPVVMVTQWNEWIAQRFIWNKGDGMYAGKPIKDGDTYFVDAFTEEFNRDMAPMKGGHTDNYYYQLISNIRKYKGMSTPQEISSPKSIDLAGDFTQWQNVTPVFKDPVGDVMHRNFKGYDPGVTYINTTGRNDIIESRATYDVNNLYFYVKTANAITSYTDPNWMLLFIDADRNKGTGWEGYDYVVNSGVKSATETTLKKWNGVTWANEVTVSYKLTGNELMLIIPLNALLTSQSTPEFYFHWADNPQQLNDISTFFTDGESAPDRRFNFNFSTSKPVVKDRSAFKNMEIPGNIEFEDFDNGGPGVSYTDATIENSGGAYRSDESVDIEQKAPDEFNITAINTNEWYEYSININVIGTVSAKIYYAATGDPKEAVLYINGTDKTGIISFESTGNLNTWATKNVDLQVKEGKQLLKFFIKKASGDFKLDKIEFTEKSVVYPGKGTGLDKTIWTAPIGGRSWFKDSVCVEVDPVIDHAWSDVGPGCNVGNDFWNIRWQGQIEPLYSEDYTFYLTVNDMGRVWIDNQLVVDGWYAAASGTTITGTIALTADKKVPVKVDFAEKIGNAKIKLEWSSASNPREVIPQRQLYLSGFVNGISETDNFSVSIFPNPAKNKITITNHLHEIDNVTIIDLQGRVMYSTDEKFVGEKVIPLTLDKGIYFLKLKGSIPFKSNKIIIE